MNLRGVTKIAGFSALVVIFAAVTQLWSTTGDKRSQETAASAPTRPNSYFRDRKISPPQDARPRKPAAEDGSEVPDEELQEWLQQAGVDTPGTLAKVLELPDSEKRRELLEWILASWTSEDREPALAWLKTSLPAMPAESAGEALELLVGAWALESPLDAMAWVTENLTGPWREVALNDVASSWAVADPGAMGAWIESQTRPAPCWTRELIQGLIPTQPAKAMEWCSRIEDPTAAATTRQNVIQSWMLSEPAAAEAWLRDHPEVVPEIRPEEPPP